MRCVIWQDLRRNKPQWVTTARVDRVCPMTVPRASLSFDVSRQGRVPR